MKKKVVLLVNLEAPQSETEMRLFLRRMFSDRSIIDAPWLVRCFVSLLMSTFRYKQSWKKYELIGGSPLQRSMQAYASALQSKLGDDYQLQCVYLYSRPTLHTAIEDLSRLGVTDITVVSMYPQSSFSTTRSLEAVIREAENKHPELSVRMLKDYYNHPEFVLFWTQLVRKKQTENAYSKPFLVLPSSLKTDRHHNDH